MTIEEKGPSGPLRRFLKTLGIRWGYVMVLVGSVAAAGGLQSTELTPSLGAAIAVIGVALLLWALERWVPHRNDWKPTPRLFGLDLLHTLVSSHGVAPVVQVGLVAAVAALAPVIGGRGLDIWPTQWPLAIQLLIAIPVADFGVYWAHRLMHTTGLGWRIHAVHHSPTKLYFMASARSHPFNAAVSVGSQVCMLLVFGIGAEALSLWAVFLAVNGLLQHANIDFRPGVLSRVLATCDVHRQHHSLNDSPCNYGNMTMIWDQLFGTYRRPPQHASDVGAAGYAIPENYFKHLAAPFVLPRFETVSPVGGTETVEHASHS